MPGTLLESDISVSVYLILNMTAGYRMSLRNEKIQKLTENLVNIFVMKQIEDIPASDCTKPCVVSM